MTDKNNENINNQSTTESSLDQVLHDDKKIEQTNNQEISNQEMTTTEKEENKKIQETQAHDEETVKQDTVLKTQTQPTEPLQTPAVSDSTKKQKTQKERLFLYKKNIDYTLSFLMLLCSAFLYYRVYKLSFFSFDWMWKIAALLIIMNIIFILLLFIRKLPNWGIWIRRIFVILLCMVTGYAGLVVNSFQTALESITQPETATTINVSLITKKDGGAKFLKDLSGKKIGIQTANDAENSMYVKEQLAKESDLTNVTYVEEIDYEGLYQKLMKGEIDGLIITNYYFNTLLKDTFPTINDDIFILKSYQKKKESTRSASTKDIRYEPFTVYIAGVDEGDDASIDARSDVNIVLFVNPLANHIEMLSIPRDSFVPNPALNYANDKLTHLGLNGVENSMKGIEEVFGIEIDFYVKLNFFSVIDIIDAIGEIEVDVPIEFCEQDENRSFAQKDLICLKEGKQKVNGKQALALARHRKSYTDVMRGKAQQEVIKGVINKLTFTAGVINMNQVLNIASKTVSTDMPMQQVTNFVSAQLDHLKPWTIESIVLENGADASLVTASMPGQSLYVMLLNKLDVQNVYQMYQQMKNQMQFSSFSFHLDALEKEEKELPDNPNVMWAGSNTSAYQHPNTYEPLPEETPTTIPEQPTIPETPDVSAPPTNTEIPEEKPNEKPEETPSQPETPTVPPENPDQEESAKPSDPQS
ncbi:MAG: ABC transporter substrate-binding protein [Erysipelotrichaceae bacterium]|nr:ABC transporter substrate-binding protein [Erysipelotrichaceae bacterium]